MKNKYFISKFLVYICFMLIFFLLFSCEDFLVEKPKNIVNPNDYYKTPAQIEGALAKGFAGFAIWGTWRYFTHSDEINGGNLVIPPDHGVALWNRWYNIIMNMNFVIDAIENDKVKEGSKAEIDNLLGMAKFIRGWSYFGLVRFWGPVPILTEKDLDNYFSVLPSRSPIKEVYDLIINDFQAGIDLMLPNPGQSSKPSQGAAKAFLAKVYLTMATHPLNESSYYQKAADLAWELIQENKYYLVEDIRDVFSYATEDGPEIMLSTQANDAVWMDYPQYLSHMRGWGDFSADVKWVEKYPEQPRKHAYIELYDADGNYYADIQRRPGLGKFFYAADWNRGWSDIQIPFMRWADVLLMYAEAANMANGGPTENAVWAINQIIMRANDYEVNPNHPLADLSMNKDEFDRKVIDERDFELCFEPYWGRWSDLIRKRILPEKIREEYLPNFSEEDYLYPIPEKELQLNSNLEQNLGYPNPYK